MHELAICQALIQQVEDIAMKNGATVVEKICLRIGPLSGVEPELLRHAFTLTQAGTVAATAQLVIESSPVRVHCIECDNETEASANRLLCAYCNSFHTQLISGDEMLLQSVELKTSHHSRARAS